MATPAAATQKPLSFDGLAGLTVVFLLAPWGVLSFLATLTRSRFALDLGLLAIAMISIVASGTVFLSAHQFDRNHGSPRRWLARPGEWIRLLWESRPGAVPLEAPIAHPAVASWIFNASVLFVLVLGWIPFAVAVILYL